MWLLLCFFFQAEDGIRDLVRSRGLGDVYKRQAYKSVDLPEPDGPITATISPSETVKFTFFRTLFWLSLIHI